MKKLNETSNRKYKPMRIGEALNTTNQNLLFKYGKLDYIIHAKWPEIVGVFFVKYTQPEKITTVKVSTIHNNENNQINTLHVNVTPAAAVEFQHFQNKIIEKINSFFGYKAVHKIKIHQKFISKTSLEKKTTKKPNDNLTQKKLEIKNTTHKINDKELEKTLLNLGVSISTYEEN